MKKIIICIFIYALNYNANVLAVDLELTDIIKQAREIQLQKELAVKNTVKDLKENMANSAISSNKSESITEQQNFASKSVNTANAETIKSDKVKE